MHCKDVFIKITLHPLSNGRDSITRSMNRSSFKSTGEKRSREGGCIDAEHRDGSCAGKRPGQRITASPCINLVSSDEELSQKKRRLAEPYKNAAGPSEPLSCPTFEPPAEEASSQAIPKRVQAQPKSAAVPEPAAVPALLQVTLPIFQLLQGF